MADDLQSIPGIGPSMAQDLRDLGYFKVVITSYSIHYTKLYEAEASDKEMNHRGIAGACAAGESESGTR